MDNAKEILLTKGYSAIVDAEDYEYLSQWKWYVKDDVWGLYAYRAKPLTRGSKLYMHRVIMNAGKSEKIDHINSNGLDNRKTNLRVATSLQNSRNALKTKSITTSIYKGVHWRKDRGRWEARIKSENKKIYIGMFKTETEAALAYNQAAIKYFGEFAKLNEIKND